MSNIVIDESRILQLEEDRVTLRNNLRSQGVSCADDETIDSLVGKVANIKSWVDVFTKNLGGTLIDDTITRIDYQYFYDNQNIDKVILSAVNYTIGDTFRKSAATFIKLDSLPTIQNSAFREMRNLIMVHCKSALTIGDYIFDTANKIKIVVVPRYTDTPKTATFTTGNSLLSLLDYGSCVAINSGTGLSNKANFKYFILRKADAITTLDNTSRLSGSSPMTFVPQAQISNYTGGTNWSATSCTFLSLEGSRFEDLDWWETVYNTDGTPKNTCTLDGNLIETADNETVAIFKHTENISHCYENGVELQDTDLVKGKTLTSTV